jgi:hypothetical protein
LKMPSLVKLHSSGKRIKRRKWGTLYSLSEQPSTTNVDTRSEVIRPHRLHLPEVVGMKTPIVRNLLYRHVVYTQGMCNASGNCIRLLFRALDYCFFTVWCTTLPRTSTRVFLRTQAACFTQTPLQSSKHSVIWVTLVWETLLISRQASLAFFRASP